MELTSPVLSDAEVEKAGGIDRCGLPGRCGSMPAIRCLGGAAALRAAIGALADAAVAAVNDGASIILVSDRAVDEDHAPVPMLLAVGAVHHRLIATGDRLHASIIAVSGEPRDAHDLACLLGLGASAVNPYLAIEQVRAMAERGDVVADVVAAQEGYRKSLEKGLLKIMSKMGVCTLAAYWGSELFEVIGLDDEVCGRGVSVCVAADRGDGLRTDCRRRGSAARPVSGGRGGSGRLLQASTRGNAPHHNSPRAVLALQKAVRSGDWDQWESYLDLVERNREPLELRDLVTWRPAGEPVPIDEVESAERIMRRFTTAAIPSARCREKTHETLAEAMNYIGGLSNSGEGGEDPARYATTRNSRIKQVASGRFGVTPQYLASGEEFQIKMAQGSKPGEGGQLPGHKVTAEIAELRFTEPGVTLISPPPHHDIYSIEDLAQLIHDLRAFKPLARISVKLVSGPGVGTITVGVAKALADVVTISGSSGGTGASPLVSIKHAGSPWELGLAEAHQALVGNGMRSTIVVEADGGMRTGRDLVVAALLGAERFGFGTLPLLALGCKMVRQCHENTCPVGIATQREDLRAKYTGSVEQVVQLFRFIAEDVRRHLAAMGAYTVDEIIGRGDLLEPIEGTGPMATEFADLLVRADFNQSRSFRTQARSPLGEQLAIEGRRAARSGRTMQLAYPIQNTDRAVGTRLSGEVTELLGAEIMRQGTVDVRLSGTAGQSFGAFLAEGVALRLTGTANDYVGKGMGGGLISVAPTTGSRAHGAGNACLYGATGGRLFVAGSVGQRFAVRNGGATAVVEGASDHCCEYMTGGTVVVLGSIGRNVAAGMTGGRLYVWDPDGVAERSFARSAPTPRRATAEAWAELEALLADHVDATGSVTAAEVVAKGAEAAAGFWLLDGRDAR